VTNKRIVLIPTFLCTIGVATAVLIGGSGDFATFIEWKDVCFPHEVHVADLEIECETCHHETNAASLGSPHASYFDDFWIDCNTCHKPQGAPAASTACSGCHNGLPSDLADETLSSKVVIHQSCWECHEIGTGADASRSCSSCHSGTHFH